MRMYEGISTLSDDVLLESVWEFRHDSGPIATPNLRFGPDGRVANYDHPNERFWRIESGVLVLSNDDGCATTRFEQVFREDDRLVLLGVHLPAPTISLRLTQQTGGWVKRPGMKEALAAEIATFGWSIGDHTYGHPQFFSPELAEFSVGKYTSMAGGVTIAIGNHRTDLVSTYPFTTLRPYWPSAPVGVADHKSKGDVSIGNDVWIASDVFICSGVSIGDGSVIGAKCVVSKDVPPYAIVAGNPGRIVKFRFPPEIVSDLLDIRWWDWPDEVVDKHLPVMMSGNLQDFIKISRSHREVRKAPSSTQSPVPKRSIKTAWPSASASGK